MLENLFRGDSPGEHPLHRNPFSFFTRVIRNPWFQLLFLGLIPMKSQASTNSVLRPDSAPKNLRCAPQRGARPTSFLTLLNARKNLVSHNEARAPRAS